MIDDSNPMDLVFDVMVLALGVIIIGHGITGTFALELFDEWASVASVGFGGVTLYGALNNLGVFE